MTDMIAGTGTGTGDITLRPAAPGTDRDSPAFIVRDRSLGTAGTSPTTVPGTAGTAAALVPGTAARAGTSPATVPGTAGTAAALVPGTATRAGTDLATVPGTAQGPVPAPTGDSRDRSQWDQPGPLSRIRDWRDRRDARSLESLAHREGQRAERDRRDQEARDRQVRRDRESRDKAAAIAVAAAMDMQRTAKAKGQAAKKQVSKGDSLDGPPIPPWMQVIGLWLDRSFGSMPLVAPLIVSGWFTFRAGYESDGMALPLVLAILLSVAFEGGVWKLSRITEKSLVAGYSTMALRLGMGLYLTIISSVIYWHETMRVGGLAHIKDANWIPSAAAALLSGLGVYIQGRAARWARRSELESAGKMDKQAIKLSGASWMFTPLINVKVMRHAVKYRLDSAVDAVRDYRLWRAASKPKTWPQLPTVGTDSPTDIAAILKLWGLVPDPSFQGQGQPFAFGPVPAVRGTDPNAVPAVRGIGYNAVPAVPGTGPAPVPMIPGTGPSVPARQSLASVPNAVPPLSLTTGTGPTDPSVPAVPGDNGTAEGTEGPVPMIRLADGNEVDQKTLNAFAERHRVRINTVLSNRPTDADDTFDWNTCPLNQITTRAIKEAGGFGKQGYALEVQKLILAIRAGVDPYSMV